MSFQQALPDSASAKCKEHCKVIVKTNNSLQQQKQQPVDMLAQMSQEIFCLIISFLPMDTRIQCTKVCHAWCNTFLQCPEIWEYIKVDDEETYKLLPLISHHVVKLMMPNENVFPLVHRINNFIHLQSLSLTIEALSGVSKTLTQLEINWIQATISLGRILSVCKILTKIQLVVWEVKDYDKNDLPETATALTSVSLQPAEDCEHRICSSRLRSLLYLCPDLEYLQLNCDSKDDDVSAIINFHDHPKLSALITEIDYFQQFYMVPNLSLLRSPSTNNMSDKKKEMLVPSNTDDSIIHGLQYLMLSGTYSIEILNTVLKVSQYTLQVLCLIPHGQQSNSTETLSSPTAPTSTTINNNWQLLHSLTLHNLGYFQIFLPLCESFLRTHLPDMLLCMPALETLVLESFYGGSYTSDIADNIYTAVSQLTRLESLRFVQFDLRGESILRLLEQPPPRLQQLIFHACYSVTYPVLERMAKIQQLRHLTQLGIDFDVTVSEVAEFLDIIGEHPNLSYFEYGLVCWSDSDSERIIRCKTLKTLVLRKLSGLTDDMLIKLRKHIENVIFIPEWSTPFSTPPTPS
ncbi:hypothetical protein INT45_002888 [Circinella minor]|uniref:F-box domain-containing protein n=1 Tax=Circinella minor TaxID=1195481 RepID=A0A8H7S8G0_9FUNG|nr:hypothetical protein INT45_002888 [Circinella minor]